jgi:hypothetical protein
MYQVYRQRFGIETSYRQLNTVRARTSSRDPGLRLLLVGLALALVNLYVTWRTRLPAPRRRRRSRRIWYSLPRLAALLGRALEVLFGLTRPVQESQGVTFS